MFQSCLLGDKQFLVTNSFKKRKVSNNGTTNNSTQLFTMPLTTRKETTASNDIKTVTTTTVTPEKSTNKREIDLGIMYYSYEMKNGLNDSHLEGEDEAEAFLKEYSDVSPKHTFSILKMNGCPTKPNVL